MPGDVLGLVGSVIDSVRFDAMVEEGGFGYVYRGEHLGLEVPVAIKCLKMRGTSPQAIGSFSGRFRDETKIAYRLSKGNLDIVRSISSGTLTTPGGMVVPYMVLEWLEGRTLAVDIAARRNNGRAPLTFDEGVAFMDSAARALDHAHQQGVVHRDVKPSNLFVAETREGRRLKVLDFGLAKIVDPEGFMTPEALPTASHVFICSPPYGAPEQFSREIGNMCPATDVYSFAFVFLELISGKKAREAVTAVEGMLKAIDPRFSSPSPRDVGLTLSDAVERVFAKAVAHKPEDRWKDLGEFWAALLDAKRSASLAPRLDIQATVADSIPAGAREEALRRANDFNAGNASTKGGTVGLAPLAITPPLVSIMPMTVEPPASPDSTVRMVSAPPPPAPIKTLPLDAKIQSVPASVVAPAPHARPAAQPATLITRKPRARPTSSSYALRVIVTLIAATVLGVAAYAIVRARLR